MSPKGCSPSPTRHVRAFLDSGGIFQRHLIAWTWPLITIYAASGSVLVTWRHWAGSYLGLLGDSFPAFPSCSQEETGHEPRVQHFIIATQHGRDHLGFSKGEASPADSPASQAKWGWEPHVMVMMPASPCLSCVASAKSLNLSQPLASCL